MRYYYYTNCVNWPHPVHEPEGLFDMINRNITITRATFEKHVSVEHLRKLEKELGYNFKMRMSADYYVTYHRSKLYGEWVYYFRYSAMEYIFMKTPIMRRKNER